MKSRISFFSLEEINCLSLFYNWTISHECLWELTNFGCQLHVAGVSSIIFQLWLLLGSEESLCNNIITAICTVSFRLYQFSCQSVKINRFDIEKQENEKAAFILDFKNVTLIILKKTAKYWSSFTEIVEHFFSFCFFLHHKIRIRCLKSNCCENIKTSLGFAEYLMTFLFYLLPEQQKEFKSKTSHQQNPVDLFFLFAPRLYISDRDKRLSSLTCKTQCSIKRAHREALNQGKIVAFWAVNSQLWVFSCLDKYQNNMTFFYFLWLHVLNTNTLLSIDCWPVEGGGFFPSFSLLGWTLVAFL